VFIIKTHSNALSMLFPQVTKFGLAQVLKCKKWLFVGVVSLSSAAFANDPVMYSISSTSGNSLTGTFLFAGELGNNGTFNFGTDGNPLSSALFTVPSFSVSRLLGMNYQVTSTGSMSGTFFMAGQLANGLQNFDSSGAPLSAPSFSWTGGSTSNLPNQNDRYLVSDGSVTALKYDLYRSSNQLRLFTNNTYQISNWMFSPWPTESGTYTVTAVAPSYETTSYSSLSFSNAPNQNDSYSVSGGSLTALNYDLYGPGGQLFLQSDGSFTVQNNYSMVIASGTYALSQVPEPSTYALVFVAIVICCALLIRRRSAD
jgi:hypothetical protein